MRCADSAKATSAAGELSLGMDRWTPLAPTRVSSTGGEGIGGVHAVFHAEDEELGMRGLPRQVVHRILDHVPVASLPLVAQASHAMQELVRDESLWKARWDRMAWEKVEGLPDALLDTPPPPITDIQPKKPKEAPRGAIDLLADLDLDGEAASEHPYSDRVKRAYTVLRPFYTSILDASSTTSSLLFTHPNVKGLEAQCALMGNLGRMASSLVQGLPAALESLAAKNKLRQVIGYLDMELRSAYMAKEAERSKGVEAVKVETAMKEYAALAWKMRHMVWLLGPDEAVAKRPPRAAAMHALGGSGIAFAHVNERPVFHQEIPHNPKECIKFSERSESAFTLAPVKAFEAHLEQILIEETTLLQRIFPHEQGVELVFFEKIATDLVRIFTHTAGGLSRRPCAGRRGALGIRIPRSLRALVRDTAPSGRRRGQHRASRPVERCKERRRRRMGRAPRRLPRCRGALGQGHAGNTVRKVAAQRTSTF